MYQISPMKEHLLCEAATSISKCFLYIYQKGHTMAVIRVNKTKDYTVMSNYHFKDRNLSLKAKGLLSLMLSLPDDWNYSTEGLVTLSSDQHASVRSALKELENFYYLKRLAVRDKGKIVDWEYHIYEYPQVEKQEIEKPQVEKPQVDFQQVGNHAQLNTNKSSIKELSIKELNIKEIKRAPNGYDAILAEYPLNEKVKETVIEFVKMRKLIKKPLTDYAFKKMLNKLTRLSSDPQTQIKILDNSITNNWQDIYELKDEQKRVGKDYNQSAFNKLAQEPEIAEDDFNKRLAEHNKRAQALDEQLKRAKGL